MLIDGTLKIITESTSSMSTSDVITMGAAFIAALTSIIGILISNRNAKKINDSNLAQQNKWNQKNIDASLKASARIEWIQKVRNTTADLLSSYSDILNTTEPQKIDDALVNSQQKTELLVLFFGPEKVQVDQDEDRNILLNKENNDGKNDILVYFIIELAQRISEYANSAKKDRYNKLQEAVRTARDEAYRNAKQVLIGYNYTEDGDEMPEYDYEWQEEDNMEVAYAERALSKEKKKINELRNDLFFLRNVIRIYLKIEWNKAKNGQ